MTTTTKIGVEGVRDALPDDLSLYLGKKTLVKLILEAVPAVNGESVEYAGFASDGIVFRNSMMLTLLTYCYATGVYATGEIEQNIQRDPMTRYLCARTYPNVDAIRSFRRHQRVEIQRCLAAVLQRAWRLRFSDTEERETPDHGYLKTQTGCLANPELLADFESEAEERLARAIRADSMALDI